MDDVAAFIRDLLNRVKTLESIVNAIASQESLVGNEFSPTNAMVHRSYIIPVRIVSRIDARFWTAKEFEVRDDAFTEVRSAKPIVVTTCDSNMTPEIDDFAAALWAGDGYVLVPAITAISFGMAVTDETVDGVVQIRRISSSGVQSSDVTTVTVIRSSTIVSS